MVVVAKGTFNLYQKSKEALVSRARVEAEVGDMKKRQEFLQNKLGELNTESGVEQEIREKFNVKKPDEEVAVIIEPDKKDSLSGSASANNSVFRKFLSGFVDIFR